ncbi:MAG TPA: ASKHA domain-containing protein, partial [Fimbriimonadaceae bacterium]|nr:ASKHA domain-containing protein [Fimbriimonadaceae bacterium]
MRIEIQFPDSIETLVLPPDHAERRLSEILRSSNLPLNTRCGERDMCAGCTIELIEGAVANLNDAALLQAQTPQRRENSTPEPNTAIPQHLDTSALPNPPAPEEFRACQYRPAGETLVIRVPERARLTYAPQVLDSYRVNVPYARDPIAAGGIGIAIDIGTTTVALQAIDLATGALDGKASGFNKQMHFGDDVLTRINLCSTEPAMLAQLQRAIVSETIQPLIAEAGIDPARIACFAIAGNTTMLHLFTGEDPSPMGHAPFTPRFLERQPFPAGSIGLEPPDAPVVLLPSIAAYIGADLTAGLFASGLLYDEGPSLLVDVGTNGEILLRFGNHVSGCATAAGPAFEGSGLTCGIRAGDGAISHIRFAPSEQGAELKWERIGTHGRPAGICGSAYVDLLAEGRRAGLLTSTGRFSSNRCHSTSTPQPLSAPAPQYLDTPSGKALQIAKGQGNRPILVTESDVAKLLQAKAAVAAGILTLLSRHRLSPADVKTLYLAGGFGMHLDLGSAIACGLLPGFEVGQIQLVGNTS